MALLEDDNVPDDYCVNRSRVGFFDLETVQIDGTVTINLQKSLRGTWETAQGFLKSLKEGEREGSSPESW